MPGIQLTNNTTLNLTASSADRYASLNRYLKDSLTFNVPAAFEALASKKVGDLDATGFPFAAGAAGEGKFAVEGTTLDIQLGGSASVGLLTGDEAEDFFSSLQLAKNPAVAGLVSFGVEGTLSAGDSAATGDFCLGITRSAIVGVTSFCPAAATDRFADAVTRAVAALTIPHDLEDLKSLPSNTTCRIAASSVLTFTASVTYNVLNDPLATTTISQLPAFSVNATAGATLEGTAKHIADHTITIAKLPNGLIHLSVSVAKTDDFETSLTVSAGIAADVGSQDALAFLLDKISPNSTTEIVKLRADLPANRAGELSGDIKAAIDATLCSSLQASLKAALEDRQSNCRVFLYEIDLNALDGASTAAVQSALTGDFTALTRAGAAFAGVRELDSVLTVTSSIRHSLTLHLLGIFNYGSTNEFVTKSKVDYTRDTHEIVLSDETIEIVGNNLDSEKLRQVVAKGITLTLPASANTPEVATPLRMVFLDRQAATSRSTLRQFVNVLTAVGAPGAAGANSLLDQHLRNYATSSLYLDLALTPQQCRRLFLDSAGSPYDWTAYLRAACAAEAIILNDDEDNADRLKLYNAGEAYWQALREAGAASNQVRLLAAQGIRQNATVDVTTVIWWSSAMENYAKALATGQSLTSAGEQVVKAGTRGFNEPWLVLAAWNLLARPGMECIFTSSLQRRARVAGSVV